MPVRTITNKFPGTCTCGQRVEAGQGLAYKDGDRWAVRHQGCEPAPSAPVHRAAESVVAERLGGGSDGYTLLSGHAASDYQAAIFDHFQYGRGSRIVKAVAGSGKTTTMKNAIRYLPEWASVQLLAFNTEAADQLKDAIAELTEADAGRRHYRNVRAGTFHSVGMGAIRRRLNLPEAQVKVESNKCRKLLGVMLEANYRIEFDGREADGRDTSSIRPWEQTEAMYSSFVCQLVGLAKGEGVGTHLRPDLPAAWHEIVEHHGLYLDSEEADVDEAIDLARELLKWSTAEAEAGWLDFDDQLYLVILWKLALWRNHVVVADEAQDTNPVRRAMLHLLLRDGGRLYAVGDEKQSIYGFTGATTDAMDLIAREFACQEMPLTVSYRCAKLIVERAQTWVPYIEAHDAAPEGQVEDGVPLWRALETLEPSDAILCRKTAPLVTVAYGMIARGRACRILGREIGDGLVNLIEQQRARGVDKLVEKLEAWREREVAKFVAKGQEQRAEGVADRVECILVIADGLPETERTVPALVARIKSMFVDPVRGEKVQRVLTLSTVHKAKGKEWDRVAILQPELMPSPAARQEWQYEQEVNLQYVACTRAKSHLIYCAEGDTRTEKPPQQGAA